MTFSDKMSQNVKKVNSLTFTLKNLYICSTNIICPKVFSIIFLKQSQRKKFKALTGENRYFLFSQKFDNPIVITSKCATYLICEMMLVRVLVHRLIIRTTFTYNARNNKKFLYKIHMLRDMLRSRYGDPNPLTNKPRIHIRSATIDCITREFETIERRARDCDSRTSLHASSS